MSEQEIKVKDLSVTIQRGKHNKENPYVIISKKMLKDKELSPKSKGVLCYLLSMTDTWQAHPRQVASAMGVGKDLIYTVLHELLITGYALKKENKGEKGRFGSVIYEFYEEKLPESERYKEKITVSAKPDTDNPDTEKPPIVNTYSKDYIPKEYKPSLEVSDQSADADATGVAEDVSFSSQKKVKPAAQFSAQVKDIADKMINILITSNPVYRPPDKLDKFLEQVQTMLEKDKQDPAILLKTFEWACTDSEQRDNFKGWQSVICTNKRKGKVSNPAEIFRGHFSTIYSQMKSKPNRKFAPSSQGNYEESPLYQEWQKGAI